jgi:hypothetical protein
MMGERRRMQGHALAAVGSAGLIASLWLPWYTFRVPAAAIDQVEAFARQFGAPGPVIQQTAAVARHLGPLHVTAWQVYTVAPAALLIIGVVAGGLSLLTISGRATGVARLVARVGVSAVIVTGYRVLMVPGQGDALHLAWGGWLALACAAAVLVGGFVALSGERDEGRVPATLSPSAPTEPAAAWSTANSVAPPTQ